MQFDFVFTADRLTRSTHRAVLEITIEGRPTVMLVPAAWLNGNLQAPVASDKSATSADKRP